MSPWFSSPSSTMSLEEGEVVSRITGTLVGAGKIGGIGTGTASRRKDEEQQDLEQGKAAAAKESPHEANSSHISSALCHGRIRFDHLATVTGLIVTYVIEIIVQIFLVFRCYPALILALGTSSASWNWSFFLAASFLLSSLVVTIVSIVWVCRGLDFAGRLCGRLLCYVMHSLLLGLLWRYLKLTFVYDRADVQEFVALRIFQAYFQSLPLTSIHLAWLISSRENWSSVSLGIIIMEFVSIVTALVLSSYIKSDVQQQQQQQQQQHQRIKSKSEVMQIIVKNLNSSCSSLENHQDHHEHERADQLGHNNGKDKEMKKTELKKGMQEDREDEVSSFWPQLLETKLTILGRALLLCSRIIVLGIIILHLKYWACMFFVVHFMVSITWISFCLNNNHSASSLSSSSTSTSSPNALLEQIMEEVSLTKGKDYATMIMEWSYVLFWDVMSIPSKINLCTWILPVLLVLLENGIVVLLDWHAAQDENRAIMTIISGTCLLMGWLLFCSLTFVSTYNGGTSGGGGGSVHSDSSSNSSSTNGSSNTTTTSGCKVCNNCCSPIPVKKDVKTGTTSKDKSQQTQVSSVIDPMIKYPTTNSHHSFFNDKSLNMVHSDSFKCNDNKVLSPLNITSGFSLNQHPAAFPNTYTRINEKLLTRMKSHAISTPVTDKLATRNNHGRRMKEHSPEALNYNNGPSSILLPEPPLLLRSEKSVINQIQQSPDPVPTTTTTWVSDTCCNDSNGSSNSRNTNTLRDNGNPIPDMDETDLENSKFVFYFPTDTSGHQSLTSMNPPSSSTCIQRYDYSCKNKCSTPVIGHHGSHHAHILQENVETRKAKKKSRSSSISSFQNVRHYSISSPVEIKKAARIPVYGPRLNGGGSNNASRDNNSIMLGNNHCHWDVDDRESKSCHTKDYHGRDASHYEKLIEDSYGILICESECSPETPGAPLVYNKDNTDPIHSVPARSGGSKKLKVLCAKCLRNHDPLLSNCLDTARCNTAISSNNYNQHSHIMLQHPSHNGRSPRTTTVGSALNPSSSSVPRTPPLLDVTNSNDDNGNVNVTEEVDENDHGEVEDDDLVPSDTTEYPSETEMTCTLQDDQLSVSTNLSTATYTTWPHQSQPNLSMWTTSTMMPNSRFPKEFTSLEYVRTWLLTSQARLRHQQMRQQHNHHNHQHIHHHHHNHEARSRLAKKVYRSHTLAAQSRKVRFVNSVITKDSPRQCHLGRRHVAVPPPQSVSPSPACRPSIHHVIVPTSCSVETNRRTSTPCSPSLSLSFQPPPRQKQHPILPPHSVIPHHRVHTNNSANYNNNNNIDNEDYSSVQTMPPVQEQLDSFHKDVEIIL